MSYKKIAAIIILCYFMGLIVWAFGAYCGLNYARENAEINSDKITPILCEEPMFIPTTCLMDNVTLSRIEADLFAAQQISWNWITVEAKCTCNSPLTAFLK